MKWSISSLSITLNNNAIRIIFIQLNSLKSETLDRQFLVKYFFVFFFFFLYSLYLYFYFFNICVPSAPTTCRHRRIAARRLPPRTRSFSSSSLCRPAVQCQEFLNPRVAFSGDRLNRPTSETSKRVHTYKR